MTIVRDWAAARSKVDAEAKCRTCGRSDVRLEAAHTAGREHDAPSVCGSCKGSRRNAANSGPCRSCLGRGFSQTHRTVDPDDIVPLCGPNRDPSSCHAADHRHELDLMPVMSAEEQARVVLHLGGIEAARKRLLPSAYGSKVVSR